MAKLLYSVICSLDGYVADRDGEFRWAAPGEEVHAFVNQRERPVGTYLYGRRMYETMAVWEEMGTDSESAAVREYAEIWRAADKIVFSHTLSGVRTARTRLERELDPAAVAKLKAEAERDLTVGGPGLAAAALRAGLVDEISLILVPVLLGGGTAALPTDVRLALGLREERRFENGMVFVSYGVLSA